MTNTWYIPPKDSDVVHYGVLGMKWGVRRYQNPDGSLTNAGRKRYGSSDIKKAYELDNALGLVSNAKSSNRHKEYATQKKIAKNTKGYNSLWNTDVKNLKLQKKVNELIINDIREKRSEEAAGAFLKDLGYNDTEEGRKQILNLFNTKELKNMATANQASRAAQISIASAFGLYFLKEHALPMLKKKIQELNAPPPKPKLSDPNGTILYENVITENIIRENNLNEIKIKEIVVNPIEVNEITWDSSNVTRWEDIK